MTCRPLARFSSSGLGVGEDLAHQVAYSRLSDVRLDRVAEAIHSDEWPR